jgi:PAS domain S-box-containing protein
MYLRVLYLVALVFILDVGLIVLAVVGDISEYFPLVILATMLIALFSALAIIGIRHNAGMGRFIVGGEDTASDRYKHIVNSQREFITCFTPEGEFLFANDAYCEFVGKSRFEIINTSIFDDVPEDEAEVVRHTIQEKIQTRQSWDFQNDILGQKGESHLIEWSNLAMFNENGEVVEIQSVGRNVSERDAAQQALSNLQTRSNQLANLASDWTWEMDKELRFTYFSPNISNFMGQEDADKFIGFSRRELFARNQFVSEEWQAHLDDLDAHRPFRNYVYVFDDMKGSRIWRSISGEPLFDENNVFCGYQGVGRDITDRIEVESEVKRQRDELEILNNQKNKFFSIIAHDLKNPVNIISGYSQLIKSTGENLSKDEILEKVAMVGESAEQLTRLVGDLLAWGQTQMQAVDVNRQAVALLPILEDAVSSAQSAAGQKSIDLVLEASDAEIETDPGLLGTVVRNLLGNAIKFSWPGQSVTITTVVDEQNLMISVRDSGTGMPRELQNNLFRLDKASSKAGTAGETGTGLGLFLCHEFIQRLGGRIEVESKEGVGSAFTVVLPVKPETAT